MAKINSAEYLVGIEKRDRRIAELEAERDRLCQCILDNPCRKALVELVARILAYSVGAYDGALVWALREARKALADTEGQ